MGSKESNHGPAGGRKTGAGRFVGLGHAPAAGRRGSRARRPHAPPAVCGTNGVRHSSTNITMLNRTRSNLEQHSSANHVVLAWQHSRIGQALIRATLEYNHIVLACSAVD